MLIDGIRFSNYIHPMSQSPYTIEDILGENGTLSQTLDSFEFRPSQSDMAGVIDGAVQEKRSAIIEAGTGTGKTLGYLIPLALSGKKTVISTGTKNLQEQIYFKDIPILSKAVGFEIDSLLMKGRKNYLCLYRFNQFFAKPSIIAPDMERIRKKIEAWLGETEFADRAELSWLPDDDPVWDFLSSSSDQCLGYDCPHMENCYLNTLRKRAAQVQIIIVNHHLFFADLMIKKSGFGEIIPRFQVAVFDEAHNIEEIATTYFGERLSTGRLSEIITDVEKEITELQKTEKVNTERYLNLLRLGMDELVKFFLNSEDRGRIPDETLLKIFEGPVRNIRDGLNHISLLSEQKEQDGSSFAMIALRADDLRSALENIFTASDSSCLKWYEKRKKSMTFHSSPLDISSNMQEYMYNKIKTVVFTSATLSTNESFDYIRSRLGIPENAFEGIFPSHFDFKNQALMYIPKDLPAPQNSEFGMKVAEKITRILESSSGRALILFTSYYNLNIVYNELNGHLPFALYKQGDAPRSILLEKFRQNTDSVLLATGSFWQGVDVPGEALSCLVIDKLPFDSPGDPLVAARIEAIRAKGVNPFMEYQLPAAIISLKQGLGRLIRQGTDRGIIAILDTRIINSRYGRFFLNSLPDMPLTHEIDSIDSFFRRL